MNAVMPIVNIHVKHDYSRGDLVRDAAWVHNCSMNMENLRRSRNLNQAELAEMAGVTQPTISRAERGDEGVTLEKFKSIATALNVPLAELFLEDRTRSENELVDMFRRLPSDRQRVWVQMAKAFSEGQLQPK